MLELAVLGLLAEQPLHGYELKKRLSETLGPLWGISFGSLYPALRRLERSGAIEEVDAEPADGAVTERLRPDRLAQGRPRRRPRRGAAPARAAAPARRTASPTAAGSCSPSCSPTSRADDERAFALKLSFCRYLDPADRLAFLERRRAQLTPAARRPRSASPPPARIDRYTRSLLEHRAQSTQHDLEWIDELIAQERAEQLDDRTEGATA